MDFIEPEAEVEAAVGTEADVEAAVGTEADVEAAVGSEADVEAAVGTEADVEAAVGTEADVEAAVGTEADVEAAVGAEARAEDILPLAQDETQEVQPDSLSESFSDSERRIQYGRLLIGPPPFGALRIAYKYVPWKWDLNTERARVLDDAGDNRRILIHYNLHRHETAMEFFAMGVVLSEESKPVDTHLETNLVENGYKIWCLPRVECAIFRSECPPQLIDAHLQNFFATAERRGVHVNPYVAIMGWGEYHHLYPMDKAEDFYVPEAMVTIALLDAFFRAIGYKPTPRRCVERDQYDYVC